MRRFFLVLGLIVALVLAGGAAAGWWFLSQFDARAEIVTGGPFSARATLKISKKIIFGALGQMEAAAMAVFVVRAGLPATTLQDFIARAKAGREQLAFGNYGYGSSSHLQGMLLARQAGLDVEPVPFNGTAQFISELLAGRLCCGFIDAGSARDFIRSGQLRPLGSTGPRRAPELPELPTLSEQGMTSFDPQIWQGMFLPAGTPPAIVAAVGRAMAEAVRRPAPTNLIRGVGYEPIGSSPEEFAAMIAHDAPIWRRIINETGVRIR
jgi:tripartite-type tricarboxylate transporter receptor subunit TctC